MVDYLLNWLHNLLVTFAALSGIGLLGYAALREFYPGTLQTFQYALHTASGWLADINLGPVVALMLVVFLVGSTLPQRESRI